MNNRLLKWSSTNNKIVNNQFGFQPQKSTIDCLFIFHSIISKALQNGNKLYCAFVDFSKAFDRIDRNFLWIKLFEGGISTKMLNAVKAMYETVKSVIKYNNNFSRSFDVFNGVKQGDPLSPILFIFFINDLVNNIKPNSELDLFFIDNLPLFALLYANDAVIFSKSSNGLQNMLDKLNIYCKRWNLKVNVEKTKVMIFEKGRKTIADIYFDDEKLELIEAFKYLGLTFFKNGKWFRSQKIISQYGNFASHKLKCLLQNVYLNVNEKIKLFDSLVSSVLNYASEVWGYEDCKDIEIVHNKFCRYLLGVKKSTNIAAMYGELW